MNSLSDFIVRSMKIRKKEYCCSQVKIVLSATLFLTNSTSASKIHIDLAKTKRNITRTISSRLQNKERFIRKVGEAAEKYIANYTDVCNNQNLSPVHRLKYFGNLLDVEAEKLHRNIVYPNFSKSFGSMQNSQ